jgi:hypothetical protein
MVFVILLPEATLRTPHRASRATNGQPRERKTLAGRGVACQLK